MCDGSRLGSYKDIGIGRSDGRREGEGEGEERIRGKQMDSYIYQSIKHISTHHMWHMQLPDIHMIPLGVRTRVVRVKGRTPRASLSGLTITASTPQ